MGQYNKAILTEAGENLIARTLAGEIQLNITKAKTSNYIYPAGTDFKSLTDMQGIKQTAIDPATAVYSNTMIQTRVLFNNEEIASTYYIHNIGLYAMDGTQEVLFCIVKAESPDEMPQYNGVASTSYIYNIQNVVQDAAQLNITVNPSGTATIQDVLERVDATGGDISETVIETLDIVEDKYPIPAAGESVKRFFGKVLTFLRNIRPLTCDINIYVSTTGSDTTGDGSGLNPYASIGKALSVVPKNLNGFTASIYVSDGTYAEDVSINGIKNGLLILRRDGVEELNSLCNINKITVSNSDSIHILGFNLIAENTDSIYATNCEFVYVNCCQSISISFDNQSFSFSYVSIVRITGCRSLNHSKCLWCYSSYIYSGSWSADSVGIQYGVYVDGGGRIATGNVYQPAGMTSNEYYGAGGIITGVFGAKIGTLKSDTTLYVSTTGSDIAGDGTVVKPFKTIQHAIDIVPKDLNGYNATINVAAGTYTEDITIKAFRGGSLNLYSANKDTLTNTCIVSSIEVSVCGSAYIRVNGFNFVTTSRDAISVYGCNGAYISYCQSTVTSSFTGIQSWESYCNVEHCKISNHNTAVLYGNSTGTSADWDSGSTGNTIGVRATRNSKVSVIGTQPAGTTPFSQSYGGIFIYSNGTQIVEFTTGLTCTWGTITGRYYKIGNIGGLSQVVVNISVTLTTNLTAHQTYSIDGLPPAGAVTAVTAHATSHFDYTQLYSKSIRITPAINLTAGAIYPFSCTYITDDRWV